MTPCTLESAKSHEKTPKRAALPPFTSIWAQLGHVNYLWNVASAVSEHTTIPSGGAGRDFRRADRGNPSPQSRAVGEW